MVNFVAVVVERFEVVVVEVFEVVAIVVVSLLLRQSRCAALCRDRPELHAALIISTHQ